MMSLERKALALPPCPSAGLFQNCVHIRQAANTMILLYGIYISLHFSSIVFSGQNYPKLYAKLDILFEINA